MSGPPGDDWVGRLRGPAAVRDAALGELRVVLVKGLRAAVGGRGADPAFCDDVAQEALVKILASLDRFEGRSRFPTWALSVAVRVALTELRRRDAAHISLDQAVAGKDPPPEPEARPDRPAEDAEYRAAVLSTLRRLMADDLTDRQRTAVQALLGGLPAEEIGRRLGITRNAAYKLVYDARARLRAGFERAGFAAADVRSAFDGPPPAAEGLAVPLTPDELRALLSAAATVVPDGLDCDDCLSRLAEFAEADPAARRADGLPAVAAHLSNCDCCREEFDALRAAAAAVGLDPAGGPGLG